MVPVLRLHIVFEKGGRGRGLAMGRRVGLRGDAIGVFGYNC